MSKYKYYRTAHRFIWMQQFEDRALELRAAPGRIDWDTASHLFNEGMNAKQAAEKAYGKTINQEKETK